MKNSNGLVVDLTMRIIENERKNDPRNEVFLMSGDRTIYLSGEINLTNATALVCELTRINLADFQAQQVDQNYERKPIRLYICSRGGNVIDMWYMVDSIMHSETQVDTYCLGYANNEAFMVFLAGEKRFISKHATLTCEKNFYTDKTGVFGLHELKEIKKFIYDRTLLGDNHHDVESFGINFSGSIYPEETSINYGVVNAII